MQLVFLDRLNLAYKDYGYVDKDFEIALDLVIIQKSVFTINKSKLNVSVGDIVILKDAPIHYIGIVERLEVADKHRTTVHVLDFKEMFSIDIPVESYSGDLSLYLENMLVGNFKQSGDSLQNLSYLTIERGSSISGELSFEPDKIMSLASLMELITKS